MADLFHLLDELNIPQDEAEQDVNQNESPEDDNALEVEEEDRQVLDLPPTLAQAVKERHETVSPTKEDEHLDLQDFAVRNDIDERQEYAELKHWWIQELQAPELLPWNDDVLSAIIEDAFLAEDETTDGSNLESILGDIRKVDKERVQFIVSNLVQARLQKMQACPWFYQQNLECLSKAEEFFLKDYLSLLEGHLETTVTNHFPQEAWRRLDEEEMIEKPDLDEYVMVRVMEDSTLRKGSEEARPLEKGSNLIVCYREVQSLLELGAVQLIM